MTLDNLPPALRKPRLRRAEACQYLLAVHGIPLAVQTLAKYASEGIGPAFHKLNRTPLYGRDELDRWAIDQLGPVVGGSPMHDNPTRAYLGKLGQI